MKYLSVCSGIEAATVAWHPLGWQALAYSEIEPFPCAVLAHHYPTIQNLGDMTQFKEWDSERLHPIDLLAGGTPCQSFSVAGLRQGLSDPRGSLMLTFLAIAERFKPRWIVWENVPGVLSSNRGRDFGTFLGALGHLGYGWAYRVLDAQWFGLAQRRRRVFVVGCLGDWRHPAAVLFKRESVRRDTAPSRTARQEVAGGVEAGNRDTGQPYAIANCLTHYRKSRRAASTTDYETWVEDDATNTLNCFDVGDVRATDVVAHHKAPIVVDPCKAFYVSDVRKRGTVALHDQVKTLTSSTKQGDTEPCVLAFPSTMSGTQRATAEDLSCSLGAKNPTAITQSMQVRRLTPRECERLQGFPDDYTSIPWRKKPAGNCPDGPRYKALGNSMAVSVMRWIGKRITEEARND